MSKTRKLNIMGFNGSIKILNARLKLLEPVEVSKNKNILGF